MSDEVEVVTATEAAPTITIVRRKPVDVMEMRTFRSSNADWAAAVARAGAEGQKMSTILRGLLRAYAGGQIPEQVAAQFAEKQQQEQP